MSEFVMGWIVGLLVFGLSVIVGFVVMRWIGMYRPRR